MFLRFAIVVAAASAVVTAHGQFVLVAEAGSPGNIRKLGMDGSDQGVFASVSGRAIGLKVSPTNSIFVSSDLDNKIYKFDMSGALQASFNSLGGFPTDIEFDQAGNIYVANNGIGEIRKFSSSGSDLGIFATTGGFATGLLTLQNGDLLVSDLGLSRILRYNSSGALLGTFANTPVPVNMCLDQSGNVLVTTFAGQVRKYSSLGADLGVFSTTLGQPWGITQDGSGGYLVTKSQVSGTGLIRKLDAFGNDVGSFTTASLASPEGIAVVPVPEPATMAILGLGTAALLRRRRKQD